MSYLTMLLGQQQSQIIELLAAQQQQQREPQWQNRERDDHRKPASKTPAWLRVLRVTLLLVVVVIVIGIWILIPDLLSGSLRYVLLLPAALLLTIGKPALNKAPISQSPFRRF